jgi:rSAM/selenodomain-associated transferase 1
VAVAVLAKVPIPGRAKTRLSPPLTLSAASSVAAGALQDTLTTVAEVTAPRRVLVLAGSPDDLPDGLPGAGFATIGQRGASHAERIEAAFEDVGGAVVLIGMDTPQLTPAVLGSAIDLLERQGVDAVLGEAADGGWWILGLRAPVPGVLSRVPMSTTMTCEATRAALRRHGLRWHELPILRDIDTAEDLLPVRMEAPRSGAYREALRRVGSAAGAVGVRTRRRTAMALAVPIAWILVAHRVGRWLQARGRRMFVNAPPLTGNLRPQTSWRLAIPLLVGLAVAGVGDRAATRMRWRTVLLASFALAAVWGGCLAWAEGWAALLRAPQARVDVAAVIARGGGSVRAFVESFLPRLDGYPNHVRGHPPGLVVLLWGLERVGINSVRSLAAAQVVIAASSVPAVLLSIREVAGEARARAAAPFVALMPAAMWWTSADGIFLGLSAWAGAALILSSGRRGWRKDALSLVGGWLAGAALMVSLGTIAAMAIPVAVLVHRRAWRVVALGMAATLGWLGLAWAWGYPPWEGQAAIRAQYAQSVASQRPYGYFVWANLAAAAIAIGPAVWAGLSRIRVPALRLLVGCATVTIVLVDLTGLTKAEVERLWLPFLPWVIAGAAAGLDGERARRGWLALQVLWTMGVAVLVRSPW